MPDDTNAAADFEALLVELMGPINVSDLKENLTDDVNHRTLAAAAVAWLVDTIGAERFDTLVAWVGVMPCIVDADELNPGEVNRRALAGETLRYKGILVGPATGNLFNDDLDLDFWPLIEEICDQAERTWEAEDVRMRYVTVQIDKRDLDVLRVAYGADPKYGKSAVPAAPTTRERVRYVGPSDA